LTDEAAADQWRSPGSARLLKRSFGDEAVVFDRRDGRTHYLSPIASKVLDALGRGPLDLDSLTAQLERSLDIHFEPDDRDHIRRILDQLVVLDLLTCTTALQS